MHDSAVGRRGFGRWFQTTAAWIGVVEGSLLHVHACIGAGLLDWLDLSETFFSPSCGKWEIEQAYLTLPIRQVDDKPTTLDDAVAVYAWVTGLAVGVGDRAFVSTQT